MCRDSLEVRPDASTLGAIGILDDSISDLVQKVPFAIFILSSTDRSGYRDQKVFFL